MVCNVHWNSDVREGRIVAAAVVAKLHSNPEFLTVEESSRLAARFFNSHPGRILKMVSILPYCLCNYGGYSIL